MDSYALKAYQNVLSNHPTYPTSRRHQGHRRHENPERPGELRVSEDCAVVGFDDIDPYALWVPALILRPNRCKWHLYAHGFL